MHLIPTSLSKIIWRRRLVVSESLPHFNLRLSTFEVQRYVFLLPHEDFVQDFQYHP